MAPAKGDWEGLALGLAEGLALGVGDAEGDAEAVFPPVVWVREAVLEELLVRLEWWNCCWKAGWWCCWYCDFRPRRKAGC